MLKKTKRLLAKNPGDASKEYLDSLKWQSM